jgi:hypothetical protein
MIILTDTYNGEPYYECNLITGIGTSQVAIRWNARSGHFFLDLKLPNLDAIYSEKVIPRRAFFEKRPSGFDGCLYLLPLTDITPEVNQSNLGMLYHIVYYTKAELSMTREGGGVN